MAGLAYPIVLTKDDNDTFLVTVPDLPEVTTYGEDKADAALRALDAIEEALAARMDARAEIPVPRKGRNTVELPAETALKVRVYQELLTSGIRRAELARRMGQHAPQIDRLFDLRHKSKVDQLDQALRAIGRRLVFDVSAL